MKSEKNTAETEHNNALVWDTAPQSVGTQHPTQKIVRLEMPGRTLPPAKTRLTLKLTGLENLTLLHLDIETAPVFKHFLSFSSLAQSFPWHARAFAR